MNYFAVAFLDRFAHSRSIGDSRRGGKEHHDELFLAASAAIERAIVGAMV